MATKNDKMTWKAGDVEITLPNGKKYKPTKATKKPAKPTKRGTK